MIDDALWLRHALFLSLTYATFACFPSIPWPALVSWVVVGSLRVEYRDGKALQDCILFGLVCFLGRRDDLLASLRATRDVFGPCITTKSSMSVLVTVVSLAIVRTSLRLQKKGKRMAQDQFTGEEMEGAAQPTLAYPQPLIFPCRTTHTRLFPKKHGFGYNYLLCGYPIIPACTAVGGKEINDDNDREIGFWWLHIRAEDYLTRGQSSLGFHRKLQSFLRGEGVQDCEWSYAYLVTAPRFLRYAFNPVSFWYVYNSDQELTKMILEVNNTFGERRIYLLDGAGSPQTSQSKQSAPSKTDKINFTDYWTKDFHVSPFNSRKGSYALKAFDPFPTPGCRDAKIDNTITLKSSKDHAKIVARVYNTSAPLNPRNMNIWDFVRFASRWWWIGLATFPRIIKEAYKLYFQRDLHVWFRPEVVGTSIGRTPTAMEGAMEDIFEDYLRYLVQSSNRAMELHYVPAIPEKPEMKTIKTHRPGPGADLARLEMRISTPAFYSRFVHYAHTSEAFDREYTFTDEKNRTLWISRPELLLELCPSRSCSRDALSYKHPKRGYMDELRWTTMRKLRCSPPNPAYPTTPTNSNSTIGDIRMLPYSDMDQFIRDGKVYAGAYRRMLTKAFLAQRFFLGSTEVVDFVDFVARFFLCWLGYRYLSMRPLYCEKQARAGGACTWRLDAAQVLAVCACHIYGLLKGYS